MKKFLRFLEALVLGLIFGFAIYKCLWIRNMYLRALVMICLAGAGLYLLMHVFLQEDD